MTAYRRFSCNDLLRLGVLNLGPKTSVETIGNYLVHLAIFPGNCIVADGPGGQIIGYLFGVVERTDEATTGRLTILKFLVEGIGKVMSSLLEANCDKVYHADEMKVILEADGKAAINACAKLGYSRYKSDSETVEMLKKFEVMLIRDTENFNEVTESTSYDQD